MKGRGRGVHLEVVKPTLTDSPSPQRDEMNNHAINHITKLT